MRVKVSLKPPQYHFIHTYDEGFQGGFTQGGYTQGGYTQGGYTQGQQQQQQQQQQGTTTTPTQYATLRSNVNKVILAGMVASDPRVVVLPSGGRKVFFQVSTSERIK